MKIMTIGIILGVMLLGRPVAAQEKDSLESKILDKVVITGTKTKISTDRSGKVISQITQRQITNQPSRSIMDHLNNVSGLQIDGNFGSLGTNISYFLRGASSRRTLILIDGIPFNDPSGINQTYDLRLLDQSQIKKIEILKGGLSSMYGTGASAGIINILLKDPTQNKKIGGKIGIDYGSFNRMKNNLTLTGNSGKISFLINAGRTQTDGFSAALDTTNSGNFDKDGFHSSNVLGKMKWSLSERFFVDFIASYDDYKTQYDGGAFSDGKDNTDSQQSRFGISPKYSWNTGSLKGLFYHNKLDRKFESSFGVTKYDATNIQADLILEQKMSEHLDLLAGINFQNQSYFNPPLPDTAVANKFQMTDHYLSLIFQKGKFNAQGAVRMSNHSKYGNKLVSNINPSFLFPMGNDKSIKIFASYATSFNTPSLFQFTALPPDSIGKLKSENTVSLEGGINVYNDNLSVEAVYFRRNDENLINYKFNPGKSYYFNSENKNETDGLEFTFNGTISKKLGISGHYTYVRRLTEGVIRRVPENKFGASIQYQVIPDFIVGVNHLYVGKRADSYYSTATFSVKDVALESYNLFNFFTSYRTGKWAFNGAVNNVLNEKFVAIYGYTTVGRTFSIGVNYNF